ncbi:MAG: SDR family NAD(P)-dependent oxidoreductase [Rhodothermaceae bacterium]
MEINEKLILITGASSGIGEAITKELLNYNCKIAIIARTKEKLDLIRQKSPESIFVFPGDVSDKTEVDRIYSEIKSALGVPDVVILNAGISSKSRIENFNSTDLLKVIDTNLSANLFWLENILPDFIKRKSGFIAAVSSMADNKAYSLSSIYCATKAALTNYLEGISIEAKKYNIKICTVRPGFVKSAITDKNDFQMPFMMEASKAAKIIVKGIIKEKRYIEFPFVMLLLTRLIGILPNRLFEYFYSRKLR